MRRTTRGLTIDDLLEGWDECSQPEGGRIDLDPLSSRLPGKSTNEAVTIQDEWLIAFRGTLENPHGRMDSITILQRTHSAADKPQFLATRTPPGNDPTEWLKPNEKTFPTIGEAMKAYCDNVYGR